MTRRPQSCSPFAGGAARLEPRRPTYRYAALMRTVSYCVLNRTGGLTAHLDCGHRVAVPVCTRKRALCFQCGAEALAR